jgi:phage major head subunit gpT-like protein
MANTLKQINDLDRDIRTTFQIKYEDVEKNEVWFNRLSTQITTNKISLTQEFILDHAQINRTDFGQPPTYHEMEGLYTTIPTYPYDDALQVSAYDITEDSVGLIRERAGDMGKRAAKHPQDLAADALARGDTSDDFLIYDGQRFFANAHPKAGTTFDNLLAGTFDSTNFNVVRTAMRRFFSDLGSDDPYGAEPNFVIGPPDLEVAFAEVLNNSWVPSSSAAIENVQKGLATSIIESRLTDTNDWYVATTDLGVMPFIDIRNSEFGNFNLVSEVSNDSPAFRDHHARRWWLRAVLRVFFTRPETMIKVVN